MESAATGWARERFTAAAGGPDPGGDATLYLRVETTFYPSCKDFPPSFFTRSQSNLSIKRTFVGEAGMDRWGRAESVCSVPPIGG